MKHFPQFNKTVDEVPNKCPYCHNMIHPKELILISSYDGYEIGYQCTNNECAKLFIGRYQVDPFNDGDEDIPLELVGCNVDTFKEQKFSEVINRISPSFVKICNEAYFADQNGLKEICGVGYRKAFEFLIKDYLISKNPENSDKIKNKFLGKCIQDDISDLKIKNVAKRAVWLGNDETHYIREWEEKTLDDLKKLILLTTHWIEMEDLHNSMIEEMPEKK